MIAAATIAADTSTAATSTANPRATDLRVRR